MGDGGHVYLVCRDTYENDPVLTKSA